MSIWIRIGDFMSSFGGGAISGVAETIRSVFEGDPDTRRQVAFSVAIIALSAKMAKADGVVTEDEVNAFRDIFDIPEQETKNVSRLYNLAKQDVAGFASYANQVRQLFPGEKAVLEDVLDGLYHIAKADGVVHEKEQAFLDTVADVFHIDERAYERIKLRHLHPEDGNPYEILDARPEWDMQTLRSHYRKLVRDNHPDRLVARGVPEEFLAIANDRMSALNTAYSEIEKERKAA